MSYFGTCESGTAEVVQKTPESSALLSPISDPSATPSHKPHGDEDARTWEADNRSSKRHSLLRWSEKIGKWGDN